MKDWQLVTQFNRTLNQIESGWVITAGEIQLLKDGYGQSERETQDIMSKMFAGFMRGRGDQIYCGTDEGTEIRSDYFGIASMLSDKPEELLSVLGK